MAKKIISWLCLAALILGLVPALASAETVESGRTAYCQHCRREVTWTAVTQASADVAFTDTHYYLAENVTGSTARVKNIGENGEAVVCFDLNGKTIQNTGRLFSVYGTGILNILDTVGNGQIICAPYSNTAAGGVIETKAGCTINIYGGTLKYSGASSTAGASLGGVIALQGVLTIYEGATLIGGQLRNAFTSSAVGTGNGGTICAYDNASIYILGGKVLSGSVPTTDKPASSSASYYNKGECIYINGNAPVYVSGNAQVDDIHFKADKDKLTIAGEFTGRLGLTFRDNIALTNEMVIGVNGGGAKILGTVTCSNNEKIGLRVIGSDLCLTVPGDDAVACIYNETGMIAYTDLSEAVAGAAGTAVKLINNVDADVALTTDAYIDLNGYSINGELTAAEGKKIYIWDSATDDYDVSDNAYGKVKLTDANKDQIVALPATSNLKEDGYVKIVEDSTASFHRVKLQIKSLTLRAKEGGLYYSSTFAGDQKVAEYIGKNGNDEVDFGVALSIQAIPDANNLNTKCLYSKFTGFRAGENGNASAATSTLLTGIVKKDNSSETNEENANKKVYGRAFIVLPDGQYVFGKPVARSLRQQTEATDTLWGQLTYPQENALMEMYSNYGAGETGFMNKWDLPNMIAESGRDREVIKILEIGNSHGLDSTNLLVEVIKKENPEAKVVVGALYKSGCRIDEHYDFMTNNLANYDYYKNATFAYDKGVNNDGSWNINFGTNSDAANKTTAYEALQDEDWDIITLQQMSHWSAVDSRYNKAQIDEIVSYIRTNKKNPEDRPILMWNMVWANPDHPGETGENYFNAQADSWKSNNYNAKDANGNSYYDMDIQFRNIYRCVQTHIVGKGNFVDVLPVATGVHYAKNILGYTQTEMYRDYTHMTDYGRLISSYIWYAKIFGISSIDSVKVTEIPDNLHVSTSRFPDDLQITEKMAEDAVKAVNWALKSPYYVD